MSEVKATPVVERTITQLPTGGYGTENGIPFYPAQQDLPELEAPEQEFRHEPGEHEGFWSLAARAKEGGWVVPLPALDECILSRESLHAAVDVLKTRRQPDNRQVAAATYGAADLIATDRVGSVVDTITAKAIDAYLAANLGQEWSDINTISYKLEEYWLFLLHKHQRAILRSLLGRDTPACNGLRKQVQEMSMSIVAPKPGRFTHVIH